MLRKLRSTIASWIAPRKVETVRDFGDAMTRQPEGQSSGPYRLRRWDSADTTRLNAEQWCAVQATSINSDIEDQLETLIARCRHERKNNPMVEGVIKTYARFVVGKGGPSLIVQSENEDYNRSFKQIWDEYWASVSVDGMSGIDLLKRLIGQGFDTGDWLQQLINFERWLPSSSPVKTRLLDLDPLRLGTPPARISSRNIVAGVERNRHGRPTQYHVRNPRDQALHPSFDWSLSYEQIAADEMLHCFISTEPGQARGVPWLSSVLQEMADLRDFDNQTLDAARAAANNGFLLWTNQPEIVADHSKVFTGSIKLERQTAKAIPPGYQASAQTPVHPGETYIPFRHEKLRSLGRIVDMPLLMVLLSAEESNFSQSRIDLNVLFQNEVTDTRQWVERCWLSPQLAMVGREAGLAFGPGQTSRDKNPFLLPQRPKDVRFSWGWEPIGQANELDHVKTQTERIKLGLTAPAMELADEGRDEDTILKSQAETNRKRTTLGLAPLPGPDQPKDPNEAEPNKTADSGAKGKAAKPGRKRGKSKRTAVPA